MAADVLSCTRRSRSNGFVLVQTLCMHLFKAFVGTGSSNGGKGRRDCGGGEAEHQKR